MVDHADWLRRADAAILQFFARERPTYVPIVANRLGIHLDYAEQRCEKLAAAEFIEPVSGEVVYRITESGETQLEAYTNAEGEPEPDLAIVD